MPEMKDSGIEWIGKMPKDWDIIPLRYLINEHFSGSWGSEAKGDEKDRICMRIADFEFEKMRFKELDEEEYTIRNYSDNDIFGKTLKYGDILIEKSGGGEKTPVGRAIIYRLNYPALFANFMDCIRLDSKQINFEYAKYVFFSLYKRGVTNLYFNQTTGLQNLNMSKFFREVQFPLPEMRLQNEIEIFLDAKCADIDTLSADIQTEIDVLGEYKKSVISEAVTRGLDSNIPMKESGVNWCPKIPIHWDIVSSKYLFRNSDVRRYEGDELLTSSQSFGIISQAEYMDRTGMKIVLANQGLEKWKHVVPNDFIISLRSFQGGLEMSEITGCITWHYVVLKANRKICYRYYKWLFKSTQYINALQGTCNFIRDGQDLRYSNFIQVPLFELPISEQERIADYLDEKCKMIDETIQEKKEQLATLEEYKKSIIYEYVTGKKEVPAV
jgi:type I restriction enzyme S subunit